MSVYATAWIWTHSQSVGVDRLVFLAIGDSANDEGDNAWPSHETLSLKTRLHHRTVERSIHRLGPPCALSGIDTPIGKRCQTIHHDELAWTSRDGRTNIYRLTKMPFSGKQLKRLRTPGAAPSPTPGAAPSHTPGAAPSPGTLVGDGGTPSTPPLPVGGGDGVPPSDPYVPVPEPSSTGSAHSTAAAPRQLRAEQPADDGNLAVLTRLAFELMEEADRDRSVQGLMIGTLADLIDRLKTEAGKHRILYSDAVLQAATSVWHAYIQRGHRIVIPIEEKKP